MATRCKCRLPGGMVFRPNGKDELDPCPYVLKEIHRNVDVEVSQCPICGAIDIGWHRTEDTEDIIFGKVEEQE